MIAFPYRIGRTAGSVSEPAAAGLPVLKGGTERIFDLLSLFDVAFFILTKVTGVINNNNADHLIFWTLWAEEGTGNALAFSVQQDKLCGSHIRPLFTFSITFAVYFEYGQVILANIGLFSYCLKGVLIFGSLHFATRHFF